MEERYMKNLSIAKLAVSTRKAQFKYKDSFEVELCYISKGKLEEIRKDCQVMKIDEATGISYPELDGDKFQERYAESIITGWKGLTGNILAGMLLIDEEELDLEEEIDYSPENALYLIRNCSRFDAWLRGKLDSLDNFRIKK